MRRKDRAISEQAAWEILKKADHGVLSLISPEGEPYGLPLNYCVIDGAIYFHCAMAGRKLDCLSANPAVSFCAIGSAEIIPREFTTRYESVIVFGRAGEVTGAEKTLALEGLIARFSGEFPDEGLAMIESMGDVTKVIKISIESLTGKSNQ
jgi:nitroimidazol reductase NimA-like FMN-containing flavoprotein (pyridoxamine 5'-phosphate oxidase superfamily)